MTIEEYAKQPISKVYKLNGISVGTGIIKSVQTYTDYQTKDTYMSMILDISEANGKYRSTIFSISLNDLTIDPVELSKGLKIVYVGVFKERWKKITDKQFELIGHEIKGLKLEIYDNPITLKVSDLEIEII